MDPGAPPKQAGRNDTRIVQYEEFVSAQQIGEFREEPVSEDACEPIKLQESRGFSAVQRPLSDLSSGKMVVEFVQAHGSG